MLFLKHYMSDMKLIAIEIHSHIHKELYDGKKKAIYFFLLQYGASLTEIKTKQIIFL